jgi:hypothetical protein
VTIDDDARITFTAACPSCGRTVTWTQRQGLPSEPQCVACPEQHVPDLHST